MWKLEYINRIPTLKVGGCELNEYDGIAVISNPLSNLRGFLLSNIDWKFLSIFE